MADEIVVVDETEKFEATSNDFPAVKSDAQESEKKEELANSDDLATEDKDEKKEVVDAGDDATAGHDKEKKPNRVQERINKVIKERETEKREKEALQRKLDALEKPGKQESKEEPSKKLEKEPVESDFEDYDKYLDALDEFEAAQEEKPTEKKDEKQDTNNEQDPVELTDSQKTALAVIREAVDAAEEIPKDFNEVALNPEIPITGDMLEALAECDDPAKIMYHLGQNPDIATKISEGTPAQQMRAIARLDIPGAVKPAKPVKKTSAPDPITPVNGSDVQEKKIEEMSFSEYEAHRNKQEQNKRRW